MKREPQQPYVGDYITSFRRDGEGTWICVTPTTIAHPNGRIQVPAGSSFHRGVEFMGVDLAAWLDEQLLSALRRRRVS